MRSQYLVLVLVACKSTQIQTNDVFCFMLSGTWYTSKYCSFTSFEFVVMTDFFSTSGVKCVCSWLRLRLLDQIQMPYGYHENPKNNYCLFKSLGVQKVICML